MRDISDEKIIFRFMEEMGRFVKNPVTIYLNGGSTAVLLGIRKTTIDVDIKFLPENNEVYNGIRELKEKLNMNIEIASPDQFVPQLPGWAERCISIAKYGTVNFLHYDLYGQALSKIQRGSPQDISDCNGFVRHSVKLNRLKELFEMVKGELVRYPAIDEKKLEQKINRYKNEYEKNN